VRTRLLKFKKLLPFIFTSTLLLSFNFIPAKSVASGTYDCNTGLLTDNLTNYLTISSDEVEGNENCTGAVIIPSGVISIGTNAFLSNTSITSVTIPNSVETIGINAFRNATSLTNVTIPNSVTTILGGAFRNTRFNSVTLGNSVTTIGIRAFSDSRLTSVTIPNSVTTIDDYAFQSIPTLTSLTLGNRVTTIGTGAFIETALTSVTIPDSVRTIEDEAFKETKLTSLDLGNGVTSIGVYSFGGINDGINHLDVVIPDSVTTLSSNAFGQSNLGNVVIGDGLETIEVAVFYNNYGQGARSIIFGSNLKRIKEAAFLGVNATNIILPDSLEHLETRAFEQTNPSLIYIPNSLFTLAVGAFDNSTTNKIIYCGSDSSIISYVYPIGKSSVCERIVKQNSNFSQVEEKYQTSASALDIELNTFNRIGYTFESWNTQKNGSGIKYTDGQNFNFLSNLTLYAQWSSLTSNSQDNQIEGTWVGKQSITCPSLNPWENEQLDFAENVAPVISSAENLVGKYITQKSLNELGNSGVIFDAFPKKVSTATETLPVFGCRDKLLNGAINQPIQFIAGGYTLQSDAHGYINTSDLKWHDTNGVTLYTNTAAFMHTIKFTNPGKYVVVLTEQPDTSRGLIPTYGVRSVRFVININ
jgi:uncharacterized repeat protein (TIGR02543 family)